MSVFQQVMVVSGLVPLFSLYVAKVGFFVISLVATIVHY